MIKTKTDSFLNIVFTGDDDSKLNIIDDTKKDVGPNQ